jgi:hypothetical protein
MKPASAVAVLAGALMYLDGMGWLRSKPAREIYGVDVRAGRFVRVAMSWLVIGLAMIALQQLWPRELPHAFGGSWRHALTVGFVTTMILGVGQRIIPVFLREALASTGLMIASFWLIVVGNAWRVSFELLTMTGKGWTFQWMGMSGVLELCALLCFAVNVVLTLVRRNRVYSRGQPILESTRVAEAVDQLPEIEHALRELRIDMFDAAPFIAPSMTFGALALVTGQRPSELVAELNQMVGLNRS